jgi:hypothetical protein
MESVTELVLLGALFGALCWESQPRLSPDGRFYMDQRGGALTRPYVLRVGHSVLMAWADYIHHWMYVTRTAVGLTALVIWWEAGAGAAALWLGLASTRTNLWFPALTDQVGILLLTLAWVVGGPVGTGIAAVGALFANEKIAVFAAIFVSRQFSSIPPPWLDCFGR